MITTLNVPFERKDEFKAICQAVGLKPQKKDTPPENTYRWITGPLWEIHSASLPKQLQPFRQTDQNRIHVLDTDYQGMITATKFNATWDKSRNITTYQGPVPPALERYRPKPYSYHETLEKRLNRDLEPIRAGSGKLIPHSHQIDASESILAAWSQNSPGFLLADSTGLGKTLSVWLGILEISKISKSPITILIVSTNHSAEIWRQTILQTGNGGHNTIGNQISITTYEKLQSLFHEPIEEKKNRTTRATPLNTDAEAYNILVLDESHNLKATQSPISQLTRKLETKAAFTIWVSSIAGENPLDLKYLTTLIAHITSSSKPYRGTYENWCIEHGISLKRAGFSRWTWIPNNHDIQTIHNILFSPPVYALKRNAKELLESPSLRILKNPIEPDVGFLNEYTILWEDYLHTFRSNSDSTDPDTQQKLTRLRNNLSLIRTTNTLSLAEELVANGYQVAICVLFQTSIIHLKSDLQKRGYNVADCTDANDEQREIDRLNFIINQIPILLFEGKNPIEIASTLPEDKPRAIIVHDIHWDSELQNRIHQQVIPTEPMEKEPLIYIPYIRKTFEEHTVNILFKIQNRETEITKRHRYFQDFQKLISSNRAH